MQWNNSGRKFCKFIVSDKENAHCIHHLQFLHCKHMSIEDQWFWKWFLFWEDLVLLERWWWQMYSPENAVISKVMLHLRCQQLLTYVPDIRLNLFSKQNMPSKESKTSDNSLNLIVGIRHLLPFFYSWSGLPIFFIQVIVIIRIGFKVVYHQTGYLENRNWDLNIICSTVFVIVNIVLVEYWHFSYSWNIRGRGIWRPKLTHGEMGLFMLCAWHNGIFAAM